MCVCVCVCIIHGPVNYQRTFPIVLLNILNQENKINILDWKEEKKEIEHSLKRPLAIVPDNKGFRRVFGERAVYCLNTDKRFFD